MFFLAGGGAERIYNTLFGVEHRVEAIFPQYIHTRVKEKKKQQNTF
jgi:hypothetical protein